MKYVAKPVIIEAFRITRVNLRLPNEQASLTLDSGLEVPAGPGRLPNVGDYLVSEPDGYHYLVSKEMFERKHQLHQEYPITMYRVVDGCVQTAAGIINAAHEEIAVQNGWSREKPELPAPTLEEAKAARAEADARTIEERLHALEHSWENFLPITTVKVQ